MIPFALWLAMSSQMMCIDSPHRRQCVAWARQCLTEEMLVLDSEEARDAAFEQCSENTPAWVWEEK
jgi:hypothetical protein